MENEKVEFVLQNIRDKIKNEPTAVTDFEIRFLSEMELLQENKTSGICINYNIKEMLGD